MVRGGGLERAPHALSGGADSVAPTDQCEQLLAEQGGVSRHDALIDESKIREIRTTYRDLAVAWHEAQGNPAVANKLFDEHHRLYKAVRDSDDGRVAICSLVGDSDPAVRLLAATHSLAWDADTAVSALRALENAEWPLAIDAKYTLKSFYDGKLNLDW